MLGAGGTQGARARVASLDLAFLRSCALEGLGVALLPDHVVAASFASGALVRILRTWRAAGDALVHLVFTATHGLRPAVRCLIDQLAKRQARA